MKGFMKHMEPAYGTCTFPNFETQEDKSTRCSRIYSHKPVPVYVYCFLALLSW